MPVSAVGNLFPVASLVYDLQPRRVLDVGIGFGLYGTVCRQILDVAHGRYERASWQADISGIEGFAEYRNPIWEYIYDEVQVGDLRELLPAAKPVDLAIFCDVLEHLSKEDGLVVIRRLVEISRAVIVSTPLVFMNDANSYSEVNPFENHLSHWSSADFRPWLQRKYLTSTTGVYLLSSVPVPKDVGFHMGTAYGLRLLLKNQIPEELLTQVRTTRRRLKM